LTIRKIFSKYEEVSIFLSFFHISLTIIIFLFKKLDFIKIFDISCQKCQELLPRKLVLSPWLLAGFMAPSLLSSLVYLCVAFPHLLSSSSPSNEKEDPLYDSSWHLRPTAALLIGSSLPLSPW
jgi:hypothetical protein